MRMHCVEQQSGTGGKVLGDSQCDGECTSGSCGRNMEQGMRSQQKGLEKLSFGGRAIYLFMTYQHL